MMNLPEYLNMVNEITAVHRKKTQELTREMETALQTAHDDFFGTLIPGDKEPSEPTRDQEWRRL